MKKRTLLSAALVFGFFLFIGCSASQDAVKPQDDTVKADDIKTAPLLRVGINPNFPPLVFKLNGKITGVEPTLARLLAQALGRPMQYVEMKWEELIPALMAGEIDIIMSGMTRTKAREMRIRFSDPYFKGGLLAAMRADNAEKYSSIQRILETQGDIGVMSGTTSDVFVQRHIPNARRVSIATLNDAAFALKTRRIDLFLADGPAIVWLVSGNEADLTGLWERLDEEELAWGVRRGDQELLTAINTLLEKWKKDGTLNRVLSRWIPYLDEIK